MVDEDDFNAWREEPITRLFLRALRDYSFETREQFEDAAWAGRYISSDDQAWLAHLRGRSETAKWFSELDFEQFKSFIEEE